MCGPSRWMVTVQRRVWPSQTWSRMSPTNSRSRPGLPRALVLRGRGSLPLSLRMEVSPVCYRCWERWKVFLILWQKQNAWLAGHFVSWKKASWFAPFLCIFGMTSVSCFEIPFYSWEDTIDGQINRSVHWNCTQEAILLHIFHLSGKAFQRALGITFWEVISIFPTVISPNIGWFPLKLSTDKTL